METLFELVEKAEYEEADLEDVMDKIRVTTYESIAVKMSYAKYIAMRKPTKSTKALK